MIRFLNGDMSACTWILIKTIHCVKYIELHFCFTIDTVDDYIIVYFFNSFKKER